jgi:small-conductance mechanosensitive channel
MTMPEMTPTHPAVLAFVVIPLGLFVALLWGTHTASRRLNEDDSTRRRVMLITAVGAAVWMTATWRVAETGVLRLWSATPPPFALLVVAILGVTAALACTGYGRRLARGLPLWMLIGIQGFRLPLELAMHALYERGVMPEQMSYSGRNFDILTGISALIVAWLVFLDRAGRRVVLTWNVLGLVLVINVVTVGILSTPPFRLFGDDRLNVFITYPPFIWLPAVMVLAALAGHVIIFRALSQR